MNYKKYLSGVLAAAMVLNTGAVSVLAKQGLIRPCRKHLRHRHHQHRKRYTSIHMMERSVPFF